MFINSVRVDENISKTVDSLTLFHKKISADVTVEGHSISRLDLDRVVILAVDLAELEMFVGGRAKIQKLPY